MIHSALLALPALAMVAKAVPAVPPPFQDRVWCERNWGPDWSDCDEVFAGTGFVEGEEGTVFDVGDGLCITIKTDDKNCVLQGCIQENKPEIPITGGGFAKAYNAIKAQCEDSKTGGHWEDGMGDTPKFLVIFNEDVEHSKRAPYQDDDESFVLETFWGGIVNDDVVEQVTANVPAGSSQAITQGEDTTYSVSVSTEVGVGIELFTASVGIETSYSVTTSWSKTDSYLVDCDPGQQGIIYWYPHWDKYVGHFYPSGDKLTVWVPVDDEGEFRVTCLD